MSFDEYTDLMLKCVNDGPYRVFTYDIRRSKEMEDYWSYKGKALILFCRMYEDLKLLEKELGKTIIVYDEEVSPDGFYVFGDAFGFTIINNSINPDIMDQIFEINAKEAGMTGMFHKCNLVYETSVYGEGHDKYLSGYAARQSSVMHKPEYRRFRKKIKELQILIETPEEEANEIMNIIKDNHEKPYDIKEYVKKLGIKSFF